MACLDSSFIIDLLRGNKEAKQFLEKVANTDEIIATTSPSVMEIMFGAKLNENKEEENYIMNLLSSLYIFELDKESAIRGGEIQADLIRAGEILPQIDIMIGAIARNNNETLITRNKKHFEKIPGLQIKTY